MTKSWGYQDTVRVEYTTKADKALGVRDGDVGVVQDRSPSKFPDVFIRRLGTVVTLSSKQLTDGVLV